MKNTKTLHLWMILPLIVMQLFIAADYWIGFTRTPWSIHVHFFTVTAWYVLLISQPYLIAKGSTARHQTAGIVGFTLAGGVGFTALSMLPNTVGFGRYVEANPGSLGAFTPEFFYAIALSEFCLVVVFLLAVFQAIRYRKSMNNHAAWLVSTAFVMLFPAIGRGVQNAAILLYGFDNYYWEVVVGPAIVSTSIIIGLTMLVASQHGILRHPAILLAIGVNFIPPILQAFPEWVHPMGEWVKAVFTLRFEGTRF